MTSYSSFEDFSAAVKNSPAPPANLDPRLRALWLGRREEGWDAAHDIVNDLGSRDGDAIHAWLHLIEGDIGNAGYWFHRARLPETRPEEADKLWETLVRRCGGW
ncbi:MAG: hypothetical protein ACKO2G_13685 [Verrucomicrobiales bacterium]